MPAFHVHKELLCRAVPHSTFLQEPDGWATQVGSHPQARRRPVLLGGFSLVGCLFGASVPASAQDIVEDEMKTAIEADEKQDGWKVTAKIGATFALNINDSVVGTEDGVTLQLGGVLSGEATYRSGPHGWSTTLSLQETQTRTPQLDRFIKSLDQLDIVTTYTFDFQNPDWLGLYARASLNTQIFNGDLVATEDLEVRRVALGASTDGLTRADTIDFDAQGSLLLSEGDARQLTSPFEPLNLRQSIGVFADPVKDPMINVKIKVGFAAQEVIAAGGGDVLVAELEDEMGSLAVVRELEEIVLELGAETELDVRGEIVAKTLSYYFTINLFYPPFTTSDVDRDFAEAINLKLKAGISLKVNEWLSAEYVLTMLRIPATTEDLQVQNGFLLSAGFEIL